MLSNFMDQRQKIKDIRVLSLAPACCTDSNKGKGKGRGKELRECLFYALSLDRGKNLCYLYISIPLEATHESIY